MSDRRRHLAQIAIVFFIVGALWYDGNRGDQALIAEIRQVAAQNAAVARESHQGLCALKNDIARRRDDAVRYLEEHPRGVVSPKTGAVIITPAEIQRGIDAQGSTLEALVVVDCVP